MPSLDIIRKPGLLYVRSACLLILLLICENTPLSAQENSTVKFGVKTGLNITGAYNIKGEEFIAKPRAGLFMGLFVTVPVGARFGIQPEIMYAQRGIRARGKMFGTAYDLTRTTTYIDAAMLANIKATDVLSLLIGPQFSYLVKQKDVFTGSTVPLQIEEFRNADVRKKTIGIIAGPEFNLNPFILGARVGWDILSNTKSTVQTTPRYRYVWYQFAVGFKFN